MKKFKITAFCLALCSAVALAGCDKEVGSAKITRDDARTGGTLSFVYDETLHEVKIGGKGEVVQFSAENDMLDLEKGCRVGLKITAPNEKLDLEGATFQMNGVSYSSGSFLEVVEGQKQRFFNIYPIVSKEDSQITFSVKWSDGTKKQTYKLVVVEGTKFMTEDGQFEE